MFFSGSATDVWILQVAGDVTMSAAMSMTLQGGAQAKNIYWQVAGQVTVQSTARFVGVILCKTAITFVTGSTLNGRALAQSAVVSDSVTITP